MKHIKDYSEFGDCSVNYYWIDDDAGDNGALDNDDLLDEEAVLAVI